VILQGHREWLDGVKDLPESELPCNISTVSFAVIVASAAVEAYDSLAVCIDRLADQDQDASVEVLLIDGVEGPSVYVNNYRIAGPKPWGGGEVIHEFKTTRAEIKRALR
jgi:hypothetical protein